MLDSLLYLLTALILCLVSITHFSVIRQHQYNRGNQTGSIYTSVYTFHFIPPDFSLLRKFLDMTKDTTATDPPPPSYHQRNCTRSRRSGMTN